MLMEYTDKVPRWRKTVSQTKTFLLYRDRNCLSVFRVLIGLTHVGQQKKKRNKNTSKRNNGAYQLGGGKIYVRE